MNKIKPNLVDKHLIENLINKAPIPMLQNLQSNIPSINISENNLIFSSLKNNWFIVIIILGVIGFIAYQYFSNKQSKPKEDFTIKKEKLTQKKKERQAPVEELPPMQYFNEKFEDKSNCTSCKKKEKFKPEYNPTVVDEPRYIEENVEHLEQPEIQQQNSIQQEQQYQQNQQRETNYSNQFYGQLITDESSGSGGGFNQIESFNNNDFGNFVSF